MKAREIRRVPPMNQMTDDEVLDLFADFLQTDPGCRKLAAQRLQPGRAMDVMREFAAAISPVPLAESTDQEMRIFVRDHQMPAISVRPLPLSEAYARARMDKAQQALLAYDYIIVAECWREFRKKVLR